MTRADLLALTPDALAALANRGLVKRAAKDLDAGTVPALESDADGTVRAAFPDGARAALPAGAGLEAATCTCGASGVCRHRIGAVLAYQRQGAGAEPEPPQDAAPWSPGAFDDDALAAVVGARALAAAHRTLRAGYAARVHRPGPDGQAWAELPACTVRFLVPGELGYVHTDAGDTRRGEVIVLAVWAFRAADERGLGDAVLDVGGEGRTGRDDMAGVLDLAERLLLDGAAHAGPVLAAALGTAEKALAARGLHWPAAVAADLADQLAAHDDRAARHDPARTAELIAELHARHRAAAHAGGSPRSAVLGTAEAGETPLRRVRLTALGCRVGGTPERPEARVLLADGAGTVLVLHRQWPEPAADIGGRRVAGAALRALAASNVVSESASRSARHHVRLSPGRIARTTVTPLGRAWEDLPAPLLTGDFAALGERIAALPPRLVRPRVDADNVHVLRVAAVEDVRYDPGGQALSAVVRDGHGTPAALHAVHSPVAPAALDRLAAALGDGATHVSGAVRRSQGTLHVTPYAVLTSAGLQVPDLAAGTAAAITDRAVPAPPDPIGAALDEALEVCADAAHHGLRHLPAGFAPRAERAAAALDATGLRAAAGAVRAFVHALDDEEEAARRWTDAQIRLTTTADLR
ncbi:hypothetical protein [Actinomadura parmotrematis]|uniref:SWIM-type domain-containing protein n=1 Tax=Actinomadura parmotrematis TaxID=2864039 RepID=A0ABS7FZF7_9ACTN|nr:hypothetical protein [Actinomadura parmotrematis]MBW8485686.1 hypothetical protein [Actinomadura parmotrematis]